MMFYPHTGVNEKGHLTLGGLDCIDLAKEYGTPLYLLDTDAVRANCRIYREAVAEFFGGESYPVYASKALCFSGIYPIIKEEGLGADCVSGGEIYTALSAGFPAEKIFFHGSNKTRREICEALDAGVGYFVVDNTEELRLLDSLAGEKWRVQKILLRITPGIDPHTHKYVSTGRIDSKFGSAIPTGAAEAITAEALKKKNISLEGFHSHIGSQIFDAEPFVREAEVLATFAADMSDRYGCAFSVLNLGGGIGVPYTRYDRRPDRREIIRTMAEALKRVLRGRNKEIPRVILEPGRSIVADAGVTLYTVGSVKRLPGMRTYVSVDGGMTDDPRYALYSSHYTALVADRAGEEASEIVTVAGRCCESGDLLGEELELQSPKAGDILAFLTTGAYNYSMASNYNRVPRPPVVTVGGGQARLAVRRESYADLTRNDIL